MGAVKSGIRCIKKSHICHGCQKTLQATERAYFQVVNGKTKVYTIYKCMDCYHYCKQHNCRACFESEETTEGYIKRCQEWGWMKEEKTDKIERIRNWIKDASMSCF